MLNSKQPIVIIDSGIGGLKCAKNLFLKTKNEHLIYFADDLFMPYGNKTKNFLKLRIQEIIEFFIEYYNPKLIIFACNTASTIYNKFLKDKYKIPIFCVSPINTYTTNCLIISTKLTRKIIIENKIHLENVRLKPCCHLATNVENCFFNKSKLNRIIDRLKLEASYKTIVLGCTHYELLENMFKEKFKDCEIICPSSVCVDEVVNFLVKFYQIDSKYNDNKINFLCSSGSKSYTDKLKLIFEKYL